MSLVELVPLPLWRHPEFARGAREMSGVALGIAAWGLVTGVAMTTSGLPLPLALLMALLVFAGSPQLAQASLGGGCNLRERVAMLFVLVHSVVRDPLAGHAARLRFVVEELTVAPPPGPSRHRSLTGQHSCRRPAKVIVVNQPAPEQVPYFWGGVVANWTSWQVPSMAGMLLADRVPTSWGLGFAGARALLGLMYSQVADRATLVAAAVAAVAIGLLIDHTTSARSRGGQRLLPLASRHPGNHRQRHGGVAPAQTRFRVVTSRIAP